VTLLRGSARRRALIVTLISLFAWEAWEGLRVFHHPWGDLKGETYTDHLSHMNAARVFPRVGLDIWRRGYARLFRRLTPSEIKRLPRDVRSGGSGTGGIFAVPGWDPAKPLVSSWTSIPRNYPPGDMLLVAPVAALYALTPLSFTTANRLLLMLFLLYAHLALFWCLELAFEPMPEQLTREWARWLTIAVVYIEVIHWTLDGFYDAAALAPLILCARFLRDRRGLAAMAAFCVAAFIHFRAFFFAPWALYALVMTVRERQWRQWKLGGVVGLAAAGVLGALSLGVFFILWPSLSHVRIHNHLNPGSSPGWRVAVLLLLFLVLVAGGARALYRSRAWLDLAVLGWMGLMLVSLREAYPWHALLAVLPWLCAPPSVEAPRDAGRVRVVRLVTWLGAICLALGFEPFAVWHLWPT
jgi:hypothetical protein